jgi:uncharacterized protein (DUF488 family)
MDVDPRDLLSSSPRALILTVGHSVHPLDEFIEMIRAHRVRKLIDVRTVPRSARNPQFNRDTLPQSLHEAGFEYAHMPALGGLRHPRRDSTNTGWRNPSFRGYADYMETPEFDEALGRLIAAAHEERVAIMCAEAVPWRCHRSMISDALVARGAGVEHIMSPTHIEPHRLTSFARVEGMRVTYPGEGFLL